MDNINSHIHVKIYYLLNETTSVFVAKNRFEVISKNILKKFLKSENYSYFLYLEQFLTTSLNIWIILIVILM